MKGVRRRKRQKEEIVKAQMEKSVRGESGRRGRESLSVSAKRGRQTEFQDVTSTQPSIYFCNFVKGGLVGEQNK